ncbi:MAG: cofactor-independent phosphoglycerate mutase [Deltaproteobacteria bacterium]|nr:cofactor-independent phosphoglycerate mutase [Deltaproteobacteria bacterium]
MKYVILLGDGMADYPIKELDNKTPLQVAKTESMDAVASRGKTGMVQTIPHGLPPGSDIANLSILGYDPNRYLTGRAVYEASSAGVRLDSHDVAFRCNLVTLTNSDGKTIMGDYSAGHITTGEARELIGELDVKLGGDQIRFYPGVSYRHLMVWKKGSEKVKTTPPHDISGRDVSPYLPEGEGAAKILQLMGEARNILNDNQVNKKRIADSKLPANSIWLWGQGRPISLPSFSERYGLSGSVISAVDLIKGMGVTLGLSPIEVPGATGYLDTNYLGKAEYALEVLKDKDFVFVHVEAPDEASHNGDVHNKIKAIEDFDGMVVKTVLEGIHQFKEYKIMVLPDHRTPIVRKTHTSEPVPFAICSSASLLEDSQQHIKFSEESAEKSGLFVENGFELMDFFIRS